MFNLRFSREIALKEISVEGYERIRNAKVTVVGLGATGSPAADLLVRAGVGQLTIIDGDVVDISNIHRQILYSEGDVGERKAVAAERRLRGINSGCRIIAHDKFLDSSNIAELLENSDLVIDGTDNMDTRRLINRHCVNQGIPWIFVSSIGTVTQAKAIIPGKTSCLECFVDPAQNYSMSCEETGVLASAPVIASSLAWTFAVQMIIGKELAGELHFIDPWNSTYEKVFIQRNPKCPVCSQA